jgi:hypothetical protein
MKAAQIGLCKNDRELWQRRHPCATFLITETSGQFLQFVGQSRQVRFNTLAELTDLKKHVFIEPRLAFL